MEIHRRRIVPFLALAVASCGPVSLGLGTAPAARAEPAAPPTPAAYNASLSLILQRAPLDRLLEIVAKSVPVHFRYGAVPDALVDASCNNQQWWPILKSTLWAQGFDLRADGNDIFVLAAPNQSPDPAVEPLVANWSCWTGATEPPADWRCTANSPLESNWKPASTGLRSGNGAAFGLDAPATSPARPAWLRCPMVLRHVPAHLLLSLESSAAVTLYVNGAPLFSHWSGTKTIDMSQVLRSGFNCVALRREQPAETGGEAAPIRYEWIVPRAGEAKAQ